MFTDMSSGVAMVSAFMCGVGAMVLGAAAYYGIKNAIQNYRQANKTMAVRNKS